MEIPELDPWNCPWWTEVERAYSGEGKVSNVLYTDENFCNSFLRTHLPSSWNALQERLSSNAYNNQSNFCSEVGKKLGKKMGACTPARPAAAPYNRGESPPVTNPNQARSATSQRKAGWYRKPAIGGQHRGTSGNLGPPSKGPKSQSQPQPQSQPQSPNDQGVFLSSLHRTGEYVRVSGHQHESPPVTNPNQARSATSQRKAGWYRKSIEMAPTMSTTSTRSTRSNRQPKATNHGYQPWVLIDDPSIPYSMT